MVPPIAALFDGNLFCAKYKYTSLKYGLFRCPVWISFTVVGMSVPFNTFLCIIFNPLYKSACLGKYLCINDLPSTCACNLGDSCRYPFPGLSYTSWIIPSCCGVFSSKFGFSSSYIISTSNSSSSILGNWYVGASILIGIRGGLVRVVEE